jgi:hypothetical protein
MVVQAERNAGARREKPIRLNATYLRGIRKLEALPQNQSGSDKSWVERVIRGWRDLRRKALLVR